MLGINDEFRDSQIVGTEILISVIFFGFVLALYIVISVEEYNEKIKEVQERVEQERIVDYYRDMEIDVVEIKKKEGTVLDVNYKVELLKGDVEYFKVNCVAKEDKGLIEKITEDVDKIDSTQYVCELDKLEK